MPLIFPSRSDYEVAIRHLDKFTSDARLSSAQVQMQTNGAFPQIYSGGRAVVFPVTVKSTKYALKCWIQNLGDLAVRYKYIHDFLSNKRPSFMLKSSYLEDEILVNGRKYPVLLMEWSDSLTLKDWINFNISNSSSLLSLAQSFVEVTREMHALYFSHGDLQHENILVDANMNLILVDYDSIFIPGLENLRDEIKGLPGFQHRSRLNLEFCNPTADYFSEYIIYLSLYGLAKKPKLWERAKDHNRLLFSDNDIQNPHTSSIIRELQDIPDLREVLDVFLRNCESESLDRIIPIVEPLGLASSPTASFQQMPLHPVLPSDLKDFSLWNPNPISPSFDWNFSTSTVQPGNTGGKSSASSKPSIDDSRSVHKINQDNKENNNSINVNPCVEDIKNSMISKVSGKSSIQKLKPRRPRRPNSVNTSGSTVSTINSSNSQKDSSASDDCFVATAVYGDTSHPDVVLLRKYRDQILSRTVVGRAFISFYWLVGPVLARTLIKASLASRLRPYLSYFVRKISTEKS
jgi:hypothetical protein